MKTASRRGFIASVGALAGASLVPSIAAAAPASQGGWDFSFLDKLNGKHRQVFDLMDIEVGLVVVKNWFESWESIFGLKSPDINAVVGIAGKGFPINVTDAMYAKYPIGELWKVNDPATGKASTRNPFAAGDGRGMLAGAGVRPLQERGAIFWMCNNALTAVAGRIANAVQKPQPEVYQDLRTGLLPGVIVVPAHTMLVGMAQEKGFTYEVA